MNNENHNSNILSDPGRDTLLPSLHIDSSTSNATTPDSIPPPPSPSSASQLPIPQQNRTFLQAPRPHRLDLEHPYDLTPNSLSPSSASTTSSVTFPLSQAPWSQHHLGFSSSSHISKSQDFDQTMTDHQIGTDQNFRRRRSTSHTLEELSSQPSIKTRSITSRSSTSSIRERPIILPESPTQISLASKRSSIAANRSSLLPQSGEHSGGWISGLSEMMANVSSRVVNTRSQELHSHNPTVSLNEPIESNTNDNSRTSHRSSVHQDASASTDALAWTSGSVHGQGSEHGSGGIRRSHSRRSSSTNAGGTNLGARSSQQGPHSQVQGTDLSRTGTGSNIGKSTHEKLHQDDEEPVFAPGGFMHRGDKMKLQGRSLKLFSPQNPLRLWLASVIKSKYTDPIILAVILTQWVFLVITPPNYDTKNTFGSYWTHYGLLAINVFYTLEIIAKSVVYGLVFDRNGFQWRKWIPVGLRQSINDVFPKKSPDRLKHSSHQYPANNAYAHSLDNEKNNLQSALLPNEESKAQTSEIEDELAHAPFLGSFYNRLDMVVVVSYWIDFVFMMAGVKEIYLFKAIGTFRPLRLLSLTEGTSTIIDSLSMSAPLLMTILGFIFFFFLILSLIGLLLFQGALSRRCAVQDPDNPSIWTPASPEEICGGYYSNGKILGIVNYIGQGDGDDSSPRSTANICQEGQVCMQFKDYSPGNGLISFDNIFSSLLTVFTISSMEGWTDVQYWVMEGDSKYAAFYFCTAIFLMSFLMIPLFIAGITYSFGVVRAEKRHSAFTNKSRKKRVLLDTEEGWQFEDQVQQVRSPFRQWLIRIVNDPWFSIGGAFLVFLDLLAMSFRRYDSAESTIRLLDNFEIAFTLLFLVEIIIRMLGTPSMNQFWKKKSNIIDLALAISSSVILIPPIYNWDRYRYLTAFQVLRAYRIIPVIPVVRDLMNAVIGSSVGMLNLILITFVFLLVCSPAPMMLFGGDMVSDDPQPINFDDLGQSFISLFIILTGENWISIMYDGLDSHDETFQQVYGAIFFVAYYCASHYVLLNLFVAIVLENFELDDDEKYDKQLEIYFVKHQRTITDNTKGVFQYLNPYAYLPARPQTLSVHGLPLEQTVSLRKNIFRQFLEGDSSPHTEEITETKGRIIVWIERTIDYLFPTQAQIEAMENERLLAKGEKIDFSQSQSASRFGKAQDQIDANLERLGADIESMGWDKERFLNDPRGSLIPEGHRRTGSKTVNSDIQDRRNAEMQEFMEAHPMYDRSLFILPSHNRFRQWCRRVVGPRSDRHLETMNRFNWFIFLCILISIGVVIADDPVNRRESLITGNTKRQDVIGDIDYVVTIIFVVEQCLRILADGFFFTPTGYLRDLWNVLDLFIIVMSCVKTFAQIDHLYSASRAIRALSCLRVLRIIRYFEGVSAMIRAISRALPRMVIALVLTILLFWPFAIYGVNVYAGYFFYCNDDTITNKYDCVGEYMSEPSGDDNGDILIPRYWSNPYQYSFDSFQAAILTLFEMASSEGWILVMQSGRALPYQLGEQPFLQPDEPNRFNTFYFLLFMLIGSIVFVQIFIGVILEAFKTWNGISLLTAEQRRWLDLRRQLRTIKPTATPARPQNPIRAFCYDLAIEKKGILWRFMTLVLVLNVALIASQHYAQPDTLTDIQDISYFLFLGVYSLEIAIKLLGYGPHKWRLSKWNLYDLAITVFAIITLIPRFIGHELWTLRLEKFLLITISFRLAQRIDSLQVLFRALAIALGSILNITAVFAIVFTLYAIMFREIFGMTRLGPSTTNLANFESFGNTMLMLIRMTTGENWDFVMHDMMVESPDCTLSRTSYLDGDCGSRPWAYVMFMSFYIVCTYILLNMFTAVIISNFSFAYQQDSITTLITREDLRNFKLGWARFDPRGTGYIDPKNLSLFLTSLEGRLCTRVYANSSYSIPNLVKAYSNSHSFTGSRASSFKEGGGGSAPSSPSLNNATSNRSVLGLGYGRRHGKHSASPNLSATTGQQSTNLSPKAIPITISKSEDGSNGKKSKLDVDFDLKGLQQVLSKIDAADVYRRRQNYNLIYKEALATCTPRGISFYSILDILSFTLVDIEHSLGLEEYLIRHERVKEVKAAVARETIYNLLLTIIARRNFIKRRVKQNARLRPEVPRIVIDTSIEREYNHRPDTSPMLNSSPSPGGRSPFLPSPTLDFSKGQQYISDEDISPIGRFSTNTMLSISSNDSNSWDERDSYNRVSEGYEFTSDTRMGSPLSPFAIEGSSWYSLLQNQITEQDDEANIYSSSP